MLEIPEAIVIAQQLDETVKGKVVARVATDSGSHRFAFFSENPSDYDRYLAGKTWGEASAYGGLIEIVLADYRVVFGEGTNVRYLEPGGAMPKKCLLHIEFVDGSAIACTVQMYGRMWAFKEGTNDSFYYLVTKEKPSPLSSAFTLEYFEGIVMEAKPSLSAKGLLATEQRIPGLGNGSAQDILFKARIHPRKKVGTLLSEQVIALYRSTKETLAAMAAGGGRDTEKDLFGEPGRYQTVLSSKTWQVPCPVCGGAIERKAFLGGNVYYCPRCQEK
jgi:formamidopyrimidine-DNA glycosylase